MKFFRTVCILLCVTCFASPGSADPTFNDGFEKHNSIMMLIDPASGTIVAANNSASKFYGYSVEVLKKKKIQEINLLTSEQVQQEIKLAKTEGRNFFIFRHQMADGEVRTVEVYSVPMKFGEKTLLYSIIQDISDKRETTADRWHYQKRLEEMVDIQTRDIETKNKQTVYALSLGLLALVGVIFYLIYALTLRRRAENALTESERGALKTALRLDEIIQSTDIGTWEWDIKSDETIVNDRWAEMIGFELNEVSPLTLESWIGLMHPDDVLRSKEMLRKNFNQKLDDYELDCRLKHKNGDWIWALIRGKVVEWNEDGRALRMSGIQKEITERKRYETQLLDARINAEAANDAKSQFLASMSHEIRTPMTGVIGFSELLLDDNLSKASRDKVLKIKNSANSLLNIINDILDMSKMEAGKMKLEYLDFHLPSMIKNVVGHFEDQLVQDGKIELVTILTKNLPEGINGDPTRLRQVFFNLIGNAVKFTDKGKIVIRAALVTSPTGDDMLNFSVEDEGIGIAGETVSRIFGEFTQADASTTRLYEGTGLGLAICRKLVELSGGTIGVQSKLGVGSKFWFTMPFVPATEKVEPKGLLRNSDEFEAQRSLHILIAEDNPVNQHIVKAFVEKYGHTATVVENGLQAIGSVNEENFDLILMDVRMPQMSGPEATQIIRRLSNGKSSIPIIALTANAMKENITSYYEAGMNEVVTKPFETAGLLLCIDKVLGEDVHKPISKMKTASIPLPEPDSEELSPVGDDRKVTAFMELIGQGEAKTIFIQATDCLEQQFRDLQVGLEEQDPTRVHEMAHSIKGASASLYGIQVSELAADIQQHAGDLDYVGQLMPKMEKSVQETIAWWRTKTEMQ